MVDWLGGADIQLQVEVDFGGALDQTPYTYTDVSTYVLGIDLQRGRPDILGKAGAGQVIVTLDNTDGRFDPNNASSPYSNMRIGSPVSIMASEPSVSGGGGYGTTYDALYDSGGGAGGGDFSLFVGSIQSWELEYPSSNTSVATWVCYDAIRFLNLINIEGTGAITSTDADGQIAEVLAQAGWPSGMRNLDDATAPAAMTNVAPTGTAWSQIEHIAESDAGVVFVDNMGAVCFFNRTHWSGAAAAATYSDTARQFTTIDVSYDDDRLVNKVVASTRTETGFVNATGTSQIASDSTSITTFGEHSETKAGLSALDDNHALNVAEFHVKRHKDSNPRVKRITFRPQRSSVSWTDTFERELFDLVTVQVSPPGGGTALNETVRINQIRHTITPDTWVVVFDVGPITSFETQTFFVLGSNTLDTDTVLA